MVARPGLISRVLRSIRGAPSRVRSIFGTPWAGAATTALMGRWSAQQESANRELLGNVVKLRMRARDLRRNNPLVARYAALSVENILGPDGITLQAQVPSSRGVNKTASRQNEALWYQWAERASLDGRSWDEVCTLLVEAWRVEGEALLEIVYDASLPFGVAVQVIDADLLDEGLNREARSGENPIVMGVELDAATARPVAFHVLRRHPSEGGRRDYRAIPADRLCYRGHRPRIGQVRGVTPLAPAMYRLQMLNASQEALVDLTHVAARKMGWLKPDAEASPLGDEHGNDVAYDFEPGRANVLPPGWDFTAWDPGQPSAQWTDLARLLGHEIAVSLDVTYSSLFGDLAEASYSSMREGKQSERESWTVKQRQFAASFCAPVYAALLRAARLKGKIARPEGVSDDAFAAATWHGRRWDYVDPVKDVSAIETKLALNLTTVTRELNAQGIDITQLAAERAAELRLFESLNIPATIPSAPAPPPAPGDVPPSRALRAITGGAA